jgi:ketosteroid isomerase-like protein
MNVSADLAIRLRRATFNRAIADGDVDPIGPILAPDAILVTGTDSGVIAGRKAQLITWKREFAASGRTVYTRTPERIVASGVEPIAMEHGQWQCVSAANGSFVASGDYSAKWRVIGGEWVIEAEIYLTLA